MSTTLAGETQMVRLARVLACCGILSGLLAFGPAAQAGVTFDFDFGTDNDFGFYDPSLGAARQAALNDAANSFSSMFASHFANTGTILLQATADSGSFLASAGSVLVGSGTPGFTAADVVKTKLLGGSDLNGQAADAVINVNFSQVWQLDRNVAVSSVQYDFYGVLYHELTHALGFYSTIARDGSPAFGLKAAGEWGTFDQFLVNNDGANVVRSDFSLNQGVWDAASVGGANPGAGMYFNGTFAMQANGGAAVGLYNPMNWLEGSSISHLDTDNPAFAGSMMLHAVGTGSLARDYSAVEVGILRDLGYTMNAVPEPQTYMLMLAGLAVLARVARRRAAGSAGNASQ